MTYRNYGHFEGDAQTYKAEAEKAKQLNEKDAIVQFKKFVLEQNLFSEADINSLEQKVEQEIEEAVKFSEESPYPTLPNF